MAGLCPNKQLSPPVWPSWRSESKHGFVCRGGGGGSCPGPVYPLVLPPEHAEHDQRQHPPLSAQTWPVGCPSVDRQNKLKTLPSHTLCMRAAKIKKHMHNKCCGPSRRMTSQLSNHKERKKNKQKVYSRDRCFLAPVALSGWTGRLLRPTNQKKSNSLWTSMPKQEMFSRDTMKWRNKYVAQKGLKTWRMLHLILTVLSQRDCGLIRSVRLTTWWRRDSFSSLSHVLLDLPLDDVEIPSPVSHTFC